jgi:peptidoglycan/LPS O-acetylase OafA/YrhL
MPIIDAIKALASQLIIWHHLAFYGPMSDVVYPYAPNLIDWFYDNARLAVQAFLVLGGFLAARSMVPHFEVSGNPEEPLYLPRLIWRRYLRLVPPYLVALLAAIAAAAFARALIDEPSIPSVPSLTQVIAHLLLLQDILDHEALSAGVWYVAIDFQLYALLVLLLWLARRMAAVTGIAASSMIALIFSGMTTASLLWINLNPELDIWAPYFFGAYGLGILAQWASARDHRWRWRLVLILLILAAMIMEWRSRMLVAGVIALMLATGSGKRRITRYLDNALLTGLGRISYSVFLIHYPVCLVVGALVYWCWPTSVLFNGLGMVLAWLLSIGAGMLLFRWVEMRSI